MIPKINSAHGPETRNIINAVIDSLNAHSKSIQELVAEGQLTPAQYAELLSVINTATPKGAYNSLSELRSAFPYGADGIYVVTENGNWYYWHDSQWTSGGVYQSTLWQNALTTQNQTWSVI